jgi:hypothetical protein
MKMTPEGAIVKQILDFLEAKRVLAFRINTGAMKSEHKGKMRFMRFGSVGMADILAFTFDRNEPSRPSRALWIECKTGKGRQSEAQKSFQSKVEHDGHRYVTARSMDDVADLL